MHTVFGLSLALLLVPVAAPAGEPTVDQLRKQLDDLKDRVKDLESGPKSPNPLEKKDSWADKVKFSGDLRLRGDIIEKPDTLSSGEVVPDRERARLRARIALDAKVNDDVKLRLRLATSESKDVTRGGDPVSTNQTMGNDESKKGIYLDIAQAVYAPAWATMLSPGGEDKDRPLEVIGGKMEMPFLKPGGTRSELLWDNDLTPEGGAAKFNPVLGPVQLLTTVGMFSVMERSTETSLSSARDAALFGYQGALKLTVDKDLGAYVLGGAAQFNFTNIQGARYAPDWEGGTVTGTTRYGNAVRPGTVNVFEYVYDYNETELFAEAGVNIPIGEHKIPLVVFGDWVKNDSKNLTQDDEGYLVGFGIGKLKDPGDLAFSYAYRKLEKEAVFGAFSGSDDGGGGTNNEGNKYSLEAQLMKNVSMAFTLFENKYNISPDDKDGNDPDNDYRRMQLDISVKF